MQPLIYNIACPLFTRYPPLFLQSPLISGNQKSGAVEACHVDDDLFFTGFLPGSTEQLGFLALNLYVEVPDEPAYDGGVLSGDLGIN